MRVAAIQHDVTWEDPAANYARLTPLIAEAAEAEARLVVLTEMYATGFSLAANRIAEAPDGPSVAYLADRAVEHGLWSPAQSRCTTGRMPYQSTEWW